MLAWWKLSWWKLNTLRSFLHFGFMFGCEEIKIRRFRSNEMLVSLVYIDCSKRLISHCGDVCWKVIIWLVKILLTCSQGNAERNAICAIFKVKSSTKWKRNEFHYCFNWILKNEITVMLLVFGFSHISILALILIEPVGYEYTFYKPRDDRVLYLDDLGIILKKH